MKSVRIAALVLLFVGLAGCAKPQTQPDTIVEEMMHTYVRGFNAHDTQELSTYFDLTDSDAQQTLAAAETAIQTAEPGVTMQIDQIIIQDVQVHGQEAVVKYQLQLKSFRDGTEVSSDIVSQDLGLKLINGTWKISGGDLPTIQTGN